MHNLIGLIRPEDAYITRYVVAHPKPKRFGAYDASVDGDATAIVRARTEAAHKAKRANHATYETVRRETAQFILSVVNDTWVRKIRNTKTLYTDVAPKALLSHFQAGYTGCHTLDLLALHNEIKRYHLKVEGLLEYINMLEDSQKQAGQVGQTIGEQKYPSLRVYHNAHHLTK